jgi:hypothetical protein
MRREDAVRQLRRVIGPLATIVVGSHRSGPHQRAAAKREEEALAAQLDALQLELLSKVNAFAERLDASRLQHQMIRLERQRSAAQARAQYYRFWAGEDHGRFQVERAKGDSWDEVLTLLNQED